MDEQEIRDALAEIIEYFSRCRENTLAGSAADKKFKAYVDAVKASMTALRDSEPVEPIKSQLAGSVYSIWQCGNCKGWLRITDVYCGRCGRRIRRDAGEGADV